LKRKDKKTNISLTTFSIFLFVFFFMLPQYVLAFTYTWNKNTGELIIQCEDGEDIVITRGPFGAILVNGKWLDDGTTDSIHANDVKILILNGDQGNNKIDAGKVDPTTFPNMERVEFNGGAGDDILIGSAFDDIMNGDDGDDEMHGGKGDDKMDGGKGWDDMHGGDGDDEMDGGDGFDEMHGDDGEDKMKGGKGEDDMDGGKGDDEMDGGEDNDKMNGGLGWDDMHGGEGNDEMEGGDGFDEMHGDDGEDKMEGGAGEDDMDGGKGDDEMDGGGDNDKMNGGLGWDDMHGGEGNDEMEGGDGFDEMHGDDGEDKMDGGDGEDDMDGGKGDDEMDGGDDNDKMNGGLGWDDMKGGKGEDKMEGGDGDDQMHGGEGEDEIHGDDGDDEMYGDDGWDEMHGGEGNDEMAGGDGFDEMHGDDGEDKMEGGEGDDEMYGGDGDDELIGGDDDDTVDGGAGDDNIDENPGSIDIIYDEAGIDTLDFSLAAMAIFIDLDLLATEQWVNADHDSIMLHGIFENFIGSQFDDNVFVDPLPADSLIDLRFLDGGDGIDTLNVNGMGGEITHEDTTITIEGFAPIIFSNFEIVNFSNNHGPLDFITILPGEILLWSGQNYQFITKGYDAENNQFDVSVNWSVDGGTISPDGLFTATTEGDFTITAEAEGSSIIGTAKVYVKRIDVNGDEHVDGNDIQSVLDNILVNSQNSDFDVNSDGFVDARDIQLIIRAILQQAQQPGQAVAFNPGLLDKANNYNQLTSANILTIKSTAGEIASTNNRVIINLDNDSTAAILQVDVSFDSTKLYPSQILLPERTMEFSAVFTDTTIKMPMYSIPQPGLLRICLFGFNEDSIRQTLFSPDTGAVLEVLFDVNPESDIGETPLDISNSILVNSVADSLPLETDNGNFTGLPGALARITIQPDSAILTPAQIRQFVATGYDGYDNEKQTTVTWTTTGGLIDSTGLYTATDVGEYTISATSVDGSISGTAIIHVIPGILTGLKITPDDTTLIAGDQHQFHVTGFDAFQNETTISVDWTTDGGKIDSSGLYSATIVGDFVVIATAAGSTINDSAKVHVDVGALSCIDISPAEANLNFGDQQQFTASGVDAFENEVTFSPVWFTDGGTINETGLFTANEVGDFKITATDTGTSITGTANVTVIPTGVGRQNQKPTEFALFQNYPNPFNPETTIEFSVKEKCFVKLQVLDITGREVAILANNDFTAGIYNIIFDARNLASGVYLYRIQMKNFVDVKKMILLE
jgi:Ca2+-binding RTX toxin-like protein